MKKWFVFAAGLGVWTSIALGLPVVSQAAALQSLSPFSIAGEVPVSIDDNPLIVKAGHRQRERIRGRKFNNRKYRRHHRQFHKRYHPRQRHYRKGHRRFHRHYRRRHRGPKIYFDFDRGYYNPYYYNPRYNDPYYYGPRHRSRLSCKRAGRIVRQHGYRGVRAYDCKGKVYGFVAWTNGRRYKVRVSAYNGNILSRRRY